ncbi:MAG: EAL domain-containing protein [Candidatus Marinimicrobia bacterium]|nr:EAL domain-containing protein [Candidatus Neomarinimicrobiota bacterium]
MDNKELKNIILETSDAAFFVLEEENFVYVNNAMINLLNYKREEFEKRNFFEIIHPDFRKGIKQKIETDFEIGMKFSRELQVLKKNDPPQWVKLTLSVVNIDSEPVIIGNLFDISEQKQKEKELQNLTNKDQVTQVFNREGIEELLRIRIAKDLREQQTGAVVALEIEGLQDFEEQYGPDMKDKILNNFTTNLQNFIRESDLIARIKEDEFIIFFDSFNDYLDAATIADRLDDKFAEPHPVEGQDIKVDFKMGVSVFPKDGKDPNLLLKNADQSLKNTKNKSSTYLFFDEEINQRRMLRQKTKNRIISALEGDRIQPYYQPIISKDGRMHRFEALARLFTEDKEVVPAEEFIPVAEKTGLVEKIDAIILDKVCRAIKKWRDQDHQLKGSVNISVSEIKEDLYEKVVSKVKEVGIPSNAIYLELTENALIESTQEAIVIMEKLRNIGVKFSIDDFGVGRSSLSRIQSLPIDEIKIDKSFAKFSDDAAKTNRSIVRAALGIAKAKEVDLVVEGVENHSAMETLFKLGVNYVQGYYFKEPLPEEAFSNLIGRYSIQDFKREFWI